MDWIEIRVVVDGEAAEAVAEALQPFAYQGSVVLEQLGDMENLDPRALEPHATVKMVHPQDENAPAWQQKVEEILYHLNRIYPIPPPTVHVLAETDWANAWKVHYHPFRIGERIWIRPSWTEIGPDDAEKGLQPEDIVLVLDPGMAFGTGLHPTTQHCVQALEQVVRPGQSVLDVGTGSGILAIAAAKLGAGRLVGVDTDELAVKTAVSNATLNGVIDLFSVWQGTLDSVTEKGWDIVVVNILAPIVIKLLEQGGLMGYVGENGRLILSGIIDQQAAGVETAVKNAGGKIIHTFTTRDWVSFIVSI